MKIREIVKTKKKLLLNKTKRKTQIIHKSSKIYILQLRELNLKIKEKEARIRKTSHKEAMTVI